MNFLLERLTGLDKLTDQVVAMDMLTAAKTAVRNYAVAVTEAATPEVHDMMRKHLFEAIDLHERLTNYLVANGWYHPHQTNEQIALDLKTMETALNLPS